MPKAEHTPGPKDGWRVHKGGNYGDDPGWFVMTGKDNDQISFPDTPEGERKARLAGAAPDMLEALKEVREFFERCGFPGAARKAAVMTQDAIAKAEGRA